MADRWGRDVENPTLSASILAGSERRPAAKLGIVADGQLSVAALEALVLRDRAYCVVQRARGVESVRQALLRSAPAVLVVDSGWSAWRYSIDPSVWSGRTLLLVDPEGDPAEFGQAARARSHGYLSRSATAAEFAVAISRVREIGSYIHPPLIDRMISERSAGPQLSHRERDILVGVAKGRSSKEIARDFAIAPKTVCNHIDNIYQKLNLRHRGQLVLYAAQHGLIRL